jgi:hypothetical protein
LEEFQNLVHSLCCGHKILTKEGVVNILCHIEQTVLNANYSPKRE